MTTEQRQLVLQLNDIKNKVQASDNREEINELILDAIKLANPIQPRLVYLNGDIGEPYYKGKENSIKILLRDSEHLNLYADIEDVHLQVSASLLMLMNKFADGISTIEQVIQ
ncbi:hypothetical protein [Mucilaginibacter sp. HD30]